MQNAICSELNVGTYRPSLHQLVRDQLRGLIVKGRLSPGTNIGEADLSEQLGTSRTPLREALKLLSAEGLIELRSNRGAYVVPIEPGRVSDAFAVAAALEELAAAQAARRGSAAELATLCGLQRRMEAEHAAGQLEPYFETNQEIHRAIVAMSRNDALQTTHDMLFGRVERLRFAALNHQPRWDESVDEHRAVLAALQARNARAAGAAMGRHVRRTGIAAQHALAQAG